MLLELLTCGYFSYTSSTPEQKHVRCEENDEQDDRLFPTADDIKEHCNLSEESNYFTMFNPNDEISTILKSTFSLALKILKTTYYTPILEPHLVEKSRHCSYPSAF
jgi:hypothetical protein